MNEKTVDKYHFNLNDLLGRGAYGSVYKAQDTEQNVWVAIKMMPKSMIMNDQYLMEALKREISVMQKLKGNNVVRLLDMLESSNNYYIVQEYCKDGDLEKYLQNQKYLTEVGAVRILVDILSGFIELLQQGIIHRDLKPANILIHNSVFKLGDFGFAKCLQNFQSELLESKVGTPLYIAPQILMNQRYTSKSDIWSIGCIFYQCLFRRTPWIANSVFELLENIQKKPLIFPSYISQEARDFLQKCLTIDENERIDWDQLYRHPLIQAKFKDFIVQNLEQKVKFLISDLRIFISTSKIDLFEKFRKLKISNNQYLTFKELMTLITDINPKIDKQDVENLFTYLDKNKENRIDFLEFQRCLQQHRVRMSMDFKLKEQKQEIIQIESPQIGAEQRANALLQQFRSKVLNDQLSLVKLFKQCDVDNNSIIDLVEFAKLVKSYFPGTGNDEISLIFDFFDKNQNGGVDFQEFRKGFEENKLIK